jgi:hypothetical protein
VNGFAALLKDPRLLAALIAALGAANGLQFAASRTPDQERGDSYRAGFELCREMAIERRDAGKERIIPRVPNDIIGKVEK